MVFVLHYPTTENKSTDCAMDFLGINKPTETQKKKLGCSTARVKKPKGEECERTRDAIRGMSKVEEVLVKTSEIQNSMHQSTKTKTKSLGQTRFRVKRGGVGKRNITPNTSQRGAVPCCVVLCHIVSCCARVCVICAVCVVCAVCAVLCHL